MKIVLNLPDLSLANKGQRIPDEVAQYLSDDEMYLNASDNVIELAAIAVRLYETEKQTRHARKGGDIDGYKAPDTRKQAINIALNRHGLKHEDAKRHLGANAVEYGALRWTRKKDKGGKGVEAIAEIATQIMGELLELPAGSYGHDNPANIDMDCVLNYLSDPAGRQGVGEDEKLYTRYKYAIETLLQQQLGLTSDANLSVSYKQIEEFAAYKAPIPKAKTQFQIDCEKTWAENFEAAPSSDEVENGGTESFIAQEAKRINESAIEDVEPSVDTFEAAIIRILTRQPMPFQELNDSGELEKETGWRYVPYMDGKCNAQQAFNNLCVNGKLEKFDDPTGFEKTYRIKTHATEITITQPETLQQIDMQISFNSNRTNAIRLAVQKIGRDSLLAIADEATAQLLIIEPPLHGVNYEPDNISVAELQQYLKATSETQITPVAEVPALILPVATAFTTESDVLAYCQKQGLASENRDASPCIWIKPCALTPAQEAELKAQGFVWGAKRSQWYFSKSKLTAVETTVKNIQPLTVAYAKSA
jgi:hypothetical protein